MTDDSELILARDKMRQECELWALSPTKRCYVNNLLEFVLSFRYCILGTRTLMNEESEMRC